MAIDNLKIAEQIKKLQEDILGILEAQAKSQRNQLEVMKQVVSSLSEVADSSNGTVGNMEKTRESLEKAAEAAEKLGKGGAMNNFATALGTAYNKSQGLGASLKAAVKILPGFATFVGMWDGFASGITFTANAMKLFGSMSTSALETLGQLAIGIISFPFKILSSLINFASSGGGDNSLRQALEDIRKEFGDLSKTSSAAIIQMSRNMKGQLANTGLSVYRTFGRLAERLKTVAEYAKNLGPLFAALSGQFVQNAESVGAYFKALGLSEEGQKAVATRAMALGQDITEVSRELANYSLQLADRFGLSAKEVSRDVGNMMADFEHFGGMAPQVLTQISVYARRLGVDVKGLLGIIDRFDNFEDAATSAAQLTQAFGLQIDALQMLKAQDPAERTEMLRKAFFAAGRSIETMTRQERALLQQQTGLEASALDLVFAQKSQGMSYEQVKKQSDSARKSQLTQEEAMQKLAGAIERLVRSGSMGGGGFFERFFQGFERGIVMSRDFRGLMIKIRMALRETYWAGAQVGRMFMELFPGIQDITRGLSGLFDRNRFRGMIRDLKATFRTFFTDLTSANSKDSFRNLMDNLKRMFWNYFDGSTPAGKGILTGLKSFGTAASVIIAGMIGEIAKGLTKGIRFVSDLLSGKAQLGGPSVAGAGGFILEMLNPIIEAVQDAWPPLVDALKDLWTEQIWPRIRDFLLDNAGTISTVLFGAVVVGAIAKGIGGLLFTAFSSAVTEGVKGMFSAAAKGAVEQGISTVAGSAAKAGIQAAVGPVAETAALGAASKTAASANVASMLKTAAIMTGGVILIIGAIVLLVEYMRARSIEPVQMITAAGVMAAASLAVLEISGAVALIGSVGNLIQASMPGFMAGMLGIAAVGRLMILGLGQMTETLSGFSETQVNNAMKALLAGSVFMLAASGVVLSAMAVGVIIAASGGSALLAIGAGLGVIGATSILMTEEINRIVDAISDLHIPSDFDRKFEVFSEVLSSISSFGASIASIAESTQNSSFMTWANGSAGAMQVMALTTLRGIMNDMSTVLMGLVRDMIAAVNSLEIAPEAFQKAELFSRIMSSLGTAVENLRPPDSLMQNEGAIFGTNISERLESLGLFIGALGDSLSTLMGRIVTNLGQIAGMSNINESALNTIQAVGSILTVLGTLGRNMMVIINQQYSNLSAEELQARLPAVSEVIAVMMNNLFGTGSQGLISSMTQIITVMTKAISGLSERDASRLKSFAPVLTAAFDAIATIGATVGNLGSLVTDMPEGSRGAALGTLRVMIGTMLYGIRDVITSLIASTKGLFTGLSKGEAANLTSGVTAFKGMIEAVVTLPGALQTLMSTFSQESDQGEGNYQRMRDRFSAMIGLFNERDDAGNPGLPRMFQLITTAFNNLPPITGDPTTKLQQLAQGLTSIQDAQSRLSEISNGMQDATSFIAAQSFTQIATNIKAMIDGVNEIATKLGAIEPININTQLKALAGNLGLGASEELTVRMRNFNVNVQLSVHVDARELENTLVDRPNTRIQHSDR